jgi:hypothetical protein
VREIAFGSQEFQLPDAECRYLATGLLNQVGDDRQREAIVTTARTGKTGASLDEIAKAVRRGDIRIQDIEDKSNIHWIQDYVIRLGQPATRLGFVGSRRQASMRRLMDPFDMGI